MKIVNPSEVWRREDEDFSPWLAKNLGLLDEILGTKLDLIEREKPVGRFFADILCVNRIDNSLVVIENQLRRSDHDHLGKLLTYTAGLQATTVIWIATAFENEHRNALEWLNLNMNNRVRCFGVKLELKPIDNSKCLPTFTLFAGPHFGNQQRGNDRSSTSHSKDQRQTGDYRSASEERNAESPYWSAFREFWSKNNSQLIPFEQTEDPNYFGFHIVQGFWFAAWRNNIETKIAAKLFMNSKENFDALKAQERAIASDKFID